MYCHVTCALFGFQAEVAKKEKEAQKRELRSRRKALRALCKVGGAHGALCKVGGAHWGHSARWVGPMGALCKVGGAHGVGVGGRAQVCCPSCTVSCSGERLLLWARQ